MLTRAQRWLLISLIAACGIVSGALNGHAQGVTVVTPIACDKTEPMLKMLKDKYHEQAIGAGIAGTGEQVRLFVSDAHTFSIIVTMPGGMSCFYTGGGDWTMKPIGDDT